MDLILAEKPSQARAIAHALSAEERRRASGVVYFVGKGVVVTSAVGHLFTLEPMKEGYPVFEFDWAPVWRRRKQAYARKYFECLKRVIKEFAFSNFIVGCDFDIEGSVIGYIAFRKAGIDAGRMRRMKMHSLARGEILRAYNSLSPPDFEWIEAGQARHLVDAIYGINLTALMSKVVARASGKWRLLSLGRVQSPTLKFVVDRERDIANFVPEKYWVIIAKLLINGKEYYAVHKLGNIKDEGLASRIFGRCRSANEGTVSGVEERAEELPPPFCFDLPSLQREAWRAFRFSPRLTESLAQKLYQQALISYPRTGTTTIAGVPYQAVLNTLGKDPSYREFVSAIISKGYRPRSGGRSDGAHIALTPTTELGKAKAGPEGKLLDLIRRRFLATFYPPCRRRTTLITIDIAGEPFLLTGTRTVERGWLEPYKYLVLPEDDIPEVRVGDRVRVLGVKLDERLTKPPPRYTLMSLVQEMERREIGTKATRAEICQKLLQRGYIKLEGGAVRPTPLGMHLVAVAERYCPAIVDVNLTRDLEEDLEKIESGAVGREDVVHKAIQNVISIIKQVELRKEEIGKELANAIAGDKALTGDKAYITANRI